MGSDRASDLGHTLESTSRPGPSEDLESAVQEMLFRDAAGEPLAAPNGFRLPIMGRSPAIRKLLETVLHVAPTDAWVLLSGESGTGKGFVADLLHQCSPR